MSDLPLNADQEAIRGWTQEYLDTMPDESPFWDSPTGQDVLHYARELSLESRNTNSERRAIQRELWDLDQA